MPGTKTFGDSKKRGSQDAGGVTQVTSQSVRQRRMQGCQGLQLCRCSCAGAPVHRFHTWPPGAAGAAASNRAVHAALLRWSSPPSPPHRKGPAGGRFQEPGPPARIVFNCQPARTHLGFQRGVCVCVPGSFPRTVPCLEEGAKFIRGSQAPEHQLPKLAGLRTNYAQLRERTHPRSSALRILSAEQ